MESYQSYFRKTLPSGLVIEVVPLTFGRARIITCRAGEVSLIDKDLALRLFWEKCSELWQGS